MAPNTLQKAARIMVVEDSPTQAAKLQRMLETNGYETCVACNGREALDMIAERLPDIIISDVLMPEMDGYTLCTKIKERPELKSIPIILLTTLDNPSDIIRGLQAGANNFLTKPYNEDQLLSRLQYAVANSELRRSTRSDIGLEIFFAGQSHFLTADRVQIIDLLISSFQTAVEKNKALEQRTSDLTKALHTIQQLEKNYRTLLDNSGDGVLVIDNQGVLRYANPAALNLLGPECAVSQLPPLQVPTNIDGVLEMDIVRNDLPPTTVEVRATGVEWEGLRARFVTLHDVTARKLALEQLERTQQEQLRIKDEFLSHVSHELRAPLSAIDGFVSILLDGQENTLTKEQRAHLEVVDRNAGQLRDMIEDILQATRAQSGKLTFEPRELSLVPVLDEVEETLRRSALKKKVAVNIEALPELPAVYADPKRVRQILLNLVGNAIKFTPAGGTITIAAWRPANEAFLQISVRDTGCGIAAENCEHIFERLYQVKDSLEQSPKGLGLGLFICRDLVTSQGGRIWLESALTRGTTFHFTLPLFAQG